MFFGHNKIYNLVINSSFVITIILRFLTRAKYDSLCIIGLELSMTVVRGREPSMTVVGCDRLYHDEETGQSGHLGDSTAVDNSYSGILPYAPGRGRG